MDELEEIRKKKLEELKQAQAAEFQRNQQVAAEEQQLEMALRQILSTDAWEQWCSAKLGNKDNAYTVARALVQSAMSGQLRGKVGKEQLKKLLSAVARQTRTEFNIRRV